MANFNADKRILKSPPYWHRVYIPMFGHVFRLPHSTTLQESLFEGYFLWEGREVVLKQYS